MRACVFSRGVNHVVTRHCLYVTGLRLGKIPSRRPSLSMVRASCPNGSNLVGSRTRGIHAREIMKDMEVMEGMGEGGRLGPAGKLGGDCRSGSAEWAGMRRRERAVVWVIGLARWVGSLGWVVCGMGAVWVWMWIVDMGVVWVDAGLSFSHSVPPPLEPGVIGNWPRKSRHGSPTIQGAARWESLSGSCWELSSPCSLLCVAATGGWTDLAGPKPMGAGLPRGSKVASHHMHVIGTATHTAGG